MKVAILDTETTRLEGQVIELAWLNVEFNFNNIQVEVKKENDLYFKPTEPIQYGAKATHHILESDLVNFPEYGSDIYKNAVEELESFDLVIGHNIDYDYGRLGLTKPKRVDTLAIARKLLGDNCDSKTQTALMYYFFGEEARPIVQNAHNALADIKMCLAILEKLINYYYKVFKPEEIKTFIGNYADLYNFSEWCRVPDKIHFGRHKGKTYLEVVRDDPDYIMWWKTRSDTKPNEYELTAINRAYKELRGN